VSEYFPHEEGKKFLVEVGKKSGKRAPLLKQVVVSPSDIIVDGALENEMLICFWLVSVA